MRGETPLKPHLAAEAEERQQRAKVLREAIRKHNRSYFEEDNPRITDAQYDEMRRELEMLETRYPQLRTVDSPLHEVGAPPSGNFSTVEHSSPMLSLANAYNDEELAGFDQSVRKKLFPDDTEKTIAYTGELKVDGLALSLVYLDRRLVRAVTRGDGTTGENVTANAREIRDLPLTLEAACPVAEIEIRGEVYMPWQNFESLNARAHDNGEKTYANPRNAAAGSMRQLGTGVVEARGLHFIAYAALGEPGLLPGRHYDTMQWLSELGFTPSPHLRRLTNLGACAGYYRELLEKRRAIQFDIDGVVFKVDRHDQQQILGQRGRSPRWAIAYKFPAALVQTKVLDVHFQVGRLGTLTPVAEVVPVFIAGVTVSKVSLHNMAIIQKLGLRIGDTVEVKRSGDVIPQITHVINKNHQEDSRAVVFPEECPDCHGKVSLTADNKLARCENGVACAAQQKNAIVHFCSRRAMNIKGLGRKLVHQLVENGLVGNVSELYQLTLTALCTLNLVAEKRAGLILKAIRNDTKPPLNLFIFALGIPEVGEETAKILARFFTDMDTLVATEQSELNELPGIGPKTADNIVRYFTEEHNATVLKQLLKHVHPQPVRESRLNGSSYVLTGRLKMSRQEAVKHLEMLGATVSGSVTTDTTALIVGNRPGGNKTDKARKLNTAIMDENAFNTLLANATESREKQVSERQKAQSHLPGF